MKFKFIIILLIFLFTLTCVSAEDDANITSDINVSFDEAMWQENLSDINVELPENATGNFSLKINDEVIYNETITVKTFKIPIKLPKDKFYYVANIYPPLDCKTYKVSAFYNDIGLNISKSLKVMKYSPDISNFLHFPNELLQYSKDSVFVVFPRSAKGELELYVDNKLFNKTNVSAPLFLINSRISNLNLGSHNITFSYLGDSYYLPFNKTFNFNVTNAVINIPDTINIGHDDCVSVDVLKNTTGTVTVFIDSKLVYKENIADGNFILSLVDYLKYNSSEITVKFTNKDFTRTKTQSVNITYDFDVYPQNFIYGEENTLEIILPDNLNNKLLKIEIDGVKYNFTRPSYYGNNIIEINISKLDSGNHTLFIAFSGDDKLASKNKTLNLTVDYKINSPYEVEFMDGSVIYLKLPKNAEGNLSVFLNNQSFATARLINGYASIRIDNLAPDIYTLNASYTGSDYNVTPTIQKLYVDAKITLTYRFTRGEDKYLTVNVPANCTGYVIINNQKIMIKNGVAKYSLKKFKTGEHELYIDYYGSNGFNSTDNYRLITVLKPKIKILSSKLYNSGVNVKVKILNRKNIGISNVKVTFKINSKTFTLKTDKNGVAYLKKPLNLKIKKYKVRVKSNGAKRSLNLKAQKVLSLKKIHIKKSDKYITLTARLKFDIKQISAKKITFIFNGVKFTKKTNKYGISKIKIKRNLLKKFKIGENVKYQAIYKNTLVEKSCIVKA